MQLFEVPQRAQGLREVEVEIPVADATRRVREAQIQVRKELEVYGLQRGSRRRRSCCCQGAQSSGGRGVDEETQTQTHRIHFIIYMIERLRFALHSILFGVSRYTKVKFQYLNLYATGVAWSSSTADRQTEM